MWGTNPLLALWTLKVAKHYSRTWPLVFNFLSNAIEVEDVPAGELDTGAFAKSLGIADDAVVVAVLAEGGCFVLLHAFFI